MPNPRSVPITPVGQANNRFREQVLLGHLGHHRILATRGILALGADALQEILHAVLSFREEDFRESFEPWGDRDFIVLDYLGQKIYAKIDTYDPSLEFQSPDPTDDVVTVRVLTLMLPDEY
jgi:hypothetical protein